MTGADVSLDRPAEADASETSAISFREALRVWIRVALLSFGGPASQIAVIHRVLAGEKQWIGERRFLHALNYGMLLPGPNAQQLAIYIGWLLRRTIGGLLIIAFGGDHVFSQVAPFFSTMAVATFGGAYAVLSYVPQAGVARLGTRKPHQLR